MRGRICIHGVATAGPDMFQAEARAFIGYPAGGEAHNLRIAGKSQMIRIIVGQRLGYKVVDYLEQNKRM